MNKGMPDGVRISLATRVGGLTMTWHQEGSAKGGECHLTTRFRASFNNGKSMCCLMWE